ncbi:hypothetical protein [Mesorhizobium sp. WSM3224]|uniref:hypothetical protein n=1 Tax=Mesorhizobium sp. WSM3224 TaxID=1040986 RepID=UPI0012EBC24C|nr:hypothetical protein [Mesorhizobium sp. WSM3224]
MRFAAMMDPADQWLVYDRSTDLPAEARDGLLIGLSQAEAERLAQEANIKEILLRRAALPLRRGDTRDRRQISREESRA